MTNNSPVTNSTAGYCHEIPASHCRHLPLSQTKLNTGKLSYQAIGFLHLGQYDRPDKLSPVCRRQIRQFKNEPIIKPKRKTKIRIKYKGINYKKIIYSIHYNISSTLYSPAQASKLAPNSAWLQPNCSARGKAKIKTAANDNRPD